MANCIKCGVDLRGGLNSYKVRTKWYCELCYFKYIRKHALKRRGDSFTGGKH